MIAAMSSERAPAGRRLRALVDLVREHPLTAVRRMVGLGLLATLLIGRRLFLDHPFFGPIPVAEGFPVPSAGLLSAWYWALVVLLAPVVLAKRARPWMIAWLALFVARCGWDRITWQPYFLHHAVTLAVLLLARPQQEEGAKERQAGALSALRWTVVLIYAWSGIAKIDENYFHLATDGIFAPLLTLLPRGLVDAMVLASPHAEVLIALALLWPRTRKAGVAAAVGMHLLILLTLGPLGKNDNPVVWPWNVVMIAFVPTIFLAGGTAAATAGERVRASLRRMRAALVSHALVFVAFGLGPLLGEHGLWPQSLSYKLYSYRSPFAQVWMTPKALAALPESAAKVFRPQGRGQLAGHLWLGEWSERELHAHAPEDHRTYRHVMERLCALPLRRGEIQLVVFTPPGRRSGERESERWICD